MFKMLSKLLDKVINIGIDESEKDLHSSQYIRYTNLAGAIGSAATVFYLSSYFLFQNFFQVITFVMIFLYMSVWIFTKLRFYTFAKIWFILLGNIHILIDSIYLGKASGAELYFYVMPIAGVFFFSRKENRYLYASVALFFLFFFTTQYLYTITQPVPLPLWIVKLLDLSSIVIVFIIVVALLYYFRNTSLSFEDSLLKAKGKIEQAHSKLEQNIKYAAIIQKGILPKQNILENYTKEHFVIWKPRDIVGGDIYFFEELEGGKEILIMLIDCVGHGVSGAFVTMLVKAIENQIIAEIDAKTLKPEPALILEYFNHSIKNTLKQKRGSSSNAGFDGGILYYNKDTKECKYAGAKTDLYMIKDGNLSLIKGDKLHVGFIRTKFNQKYSQHSIKLDKNLQLYLTTDGIVDQKNEKRERYGIYRLESILLKASSHPMQKQAKLILQSFEEFKKDNIQTDDITVIGLNFKEQ